MCLADPPAQVVDDILEIDKKHGIGSPLPERQAAMLVRGHKHEKLRLRKNLRFNNNKIARQSNVAWRSCY